LANCSSYKGRPLSYPHLRIFGCWYSRRLSHCPRHICRLFQKKARPEKVYSRCRGGMFHSSYPYTPPLSNTLNIP
jgi:hypothetical protein